VVKKRSKLTSGNLMLESIGLTIPLAAPYRTTRLAT
jgi:hypothetical protein